METNVKRIFVTNYEDFENCYIFSPSIGRKKNVGGKTYRVTRYFNGNRDFETSIHISTRSSGEAISKR